MSKAAMVIAFFVMGSFIATLACQDEGSAPGESKVRIQEKDQEKEQEKKKRILVPADDDKSEERIDFMRIKMQSSQLILEGLTVKDFDLVNKGIQQVKAMTKSGKWVSIDDEFYRELVSDFELTTQKLEESAPFQIF